MAAKLSDLVEEISGANLQMDGHVNVPSQSVKDPWEPEEENSFPSHLLSWPQPGGCYQAALIGNTVWRYE